MTENPASAEPVLPLRWCVSPDSLAQLSAENAVHLHLLISVQNNGREVLRRCVPLEQAMEYLELNHAGLNKVNAVIIWNRRDDPRQLQHEAMRSSRPYNWEGTFDPSELDIDGVRVVKDGTANIDVNVPDEFFAHEPPEWERRWVNFLFENEPKDQCAYRRRRLLAYSIQLPIVVLLAIFITMLRIVYALLTIFMGVRGLNPEPILHPFRDSTEEIWVNPDFFPLSGVDAWLSERNNFFVADADGRKRPFGFVMLHPLVLMAVGGSPLLLYVLNLNLMFLFGFIMMMSGLVCLAILVGIGIMKVISWTNSHFAKRSCDTFEPFPYALTETTQIRLAKFEATFADVTCGAVPMRVDIRTLKKPPISLRFKALKAKVCRPYIVR